MSYCRFSSDNWQSDVYCYEHYGGWFQIEVAGNRIIGNIPKVINWKDKDFFLKHREQMDFIESAEREKIGLECDGESYQCGSFKEMINKLKELKKVGYNIPEFMFKINNVK